MKRQKEKKLVQLAACRLKGHEIKNRLLPGEPNEKYCLTCFVKEKNIYMDMDTYTIRQGNENTKKK